MAGAESNDIRRRSNGINCIRVILQRPSEIKLPSEVILDEFKLARHFLYTSSPYQKSIYFWLDVQKQMCAIETIKIIQRKMEG